MSSIDFNTIPVEHQEFVKTVCQKLQELNEVRREIYNFIDENRPDGFHDSLAYERYILAKWDNASDVPSGVYPEDIWYASDLDC
jgi:hypothetical protein